MHSTFGALSPDTQMMLLLDAERTMVEDFSTGCSAGLALRTQLLQFVNFLFFQCQFLKKKKVMEGWFWPDFLFYSLCCNF